jgi:DNA-binding response OmpR family regulator
MYWAQTRRSSAVQVIDNQSTEIATGRILVVDDDRTFGGFMLAALQSRGHEVEWAGSIQDGLASLYACRYDLVIIDLRLPDGNGVEFLRDATDEGLLAESSAIILTGHTFDQPDDIRVFYKPFDLDPFLDKMGAIIFQTQRRRVGPKRPKGSAKAGANDDGRTGTAHRIELVLYTSPASEKCQKAIRAIQDVLVNYNRAQVRFTICDLSRSSGQEDPVVFTPTLVKRGPGPRTWIIGNLDQPELLMDLLDVSGVERRRD